MGLSVKTWRWNFWVCVLAVLPLSLMPVGLYMPTTGWDKANHLLAFSVMAVLGYRAYPALTITVLAGLLGLGHVNKGTSEMGKPIYEYEYVDQYQKRSSFGLLMLDLWIIWRGIRVIVKGGALEAAVQSLQNNSLCEPVRINVSVPVFTSPLLS